MSPLLAPRTGQLPGLDVLKFAMALLVVSIHAHLFEEWAPLFRFVQPLKYSAVPLFFVISSFLHFRRIPGNDTEWTSVGHYVRRLAVFYLFWFTVLLPVTIVERKWHLHFDASLFLVNFFLGSTFRGSYFIMALMLGVPIVHVARRFLPPLAVVFVALAIHLPCLFPEMWPRAAAQGKFTFLPYLLWIAVGALLADLPPQTEHSWKAILASLLLYAGMLLPKMEPLLKPAFAILLFSLFLNWNLRPRPVFVTMRKMSILVFVTHFVFNNLAWFVARKWVPALNNSILHYAVILSCAMIVSWLLLELSGKRWFAWLKWGL